jgi:hypothetical protein
MSDDEDILKDTWAYQEIFQKGFLQGYQEAFQETLQRERPQELRRQRKMPSRLVRLRFPKLTKLAKKCAKRNSDPAELQMIIDKIFSTKTKKEMKLVLLGIDSEKKANTQT